MMDKIIGGVLVLLGIVTFFGLFFIDGMLVNQPLALLAVVLIIPVLAVWVGISLLMSHRSTAPPLRKKRRS